MRMQMPQGGLRGAYSQHSFLQDTALQQVMSVVGCSRSTARAMLMHFRWDVDTLCGRLSPYPIWHVRQDSSSHVQSDHLVQAPAYFLGFMCLLRTRTTPALRHALCINWTGASNRARPVTAGSRKMLSKLLHCVCRDHG